MQPVTDTAEEFDLIPAVTWDFDEATGTLTISGTGAMANYYSSSSDRPWADKLSDIKSVVIENGVTSIGSYAFEHCTGLESVTIPNSVTSIGYYAFQSCASLTAVNYCGSKRKWDKIDIGVSNEPLQNANIVYNYVKE